MNEQNTNNMTATPTPEVPVTPIEPITPVSPVAPTTPVAPVTPIEPIQPITPVAPVVPEAPVVEQPAVEAQPVNSTPITPVAEAPIQPVSPEVPVTPVQPVTPVTPVVETPVQPVSPEVPVNPQVTPTPVQPVVDVPVVNGLDNSQTVATVQNGGIPNSGVYAPSVPVNGPIDSTNVGFVQTGTDLKKKKNPLVIAGIVIVILAILGAVGYFVIYPKLMEKYNDPKTIFKATFNEIGKQVGTTVASLVHDKNIYEVKATIDSDYEGIKDYSGYTYMGRFGIDPENKIAELGYGVTDNSTKTEYSNYYYIKNNSLYTKFSTYRSLIYAGTVEESDISDLFEQFNEILKNTDSTMDDNANLIVNTTMNAIANSFDENNFKSEDTSITVAGNSIKVKKSNYAVTKDIAEAMVDKVVQELSNNDDYINALYEIAKTSDDTLTKDSIKESISSIKASDLDIDDDFNTEINIYTTGTKAQFVGIEVVSDKDSIHYYTLNNNFEIIDHSDDQDVISIIGVANDSVTDVTVKVEDVEYATLKIRKWTDTEIDFDYVLNIPMSLMDDDYNTDEKYVLTGTITYKETTTNENSQYELSAKVVFPEKTYIKVDISFLNDWTSDVANIKTSTAETLSEDELTTVYSSFMEYLMSTPIKNLISTVDGLTDTSVTDYGSSYYYNYDSTSDYTSSDYDYDYSYSYSYTDDEDKTTTTTESDSSPLQGLVDKSKSFIR